MINLICLFKGHSWGDTYLDKAIAKEWGVFTCHRCWFKLGQRPRYVEPFERLLEKEQS